MGACATKPKDLKGEAPETAPENVPTTEIAAKDAAEVSVAAKDAAEVSVAAKDAAEVAVDAKEVVVVAKEEAKKEIEGGATADDDAERRRSLSNLFKENEEGKRSEQVKEEASQITPSEAKPEEVEKVIDAPVTSEIEKAPEVASIRAEAPKVEASEEKKIEEVKSEPKTPAEKQVEEVKPAAETPAEKKIEEAPAATDAPAPVETKAEGAPKVTVIEENKSS